MKTLMTLAFVTPVIADNSKDLSYWKTATVEQINSANKTIAENVSVASSLVNEFNPNYNKIKSHLHTAINLCNTMHCKSSKGVCLEAFKISGMVDYLERS